MIFYFFKMIGFIIGFFFLFIIPFGLFIYFVFLCFKNLFDNEE